MNVIPATDLKQWAYCPRIVFYHQTMPGVGRSTYKMAEGLRAQELIESLEMRRTLEKYGLAGAGRRWGVWLASEELGISGKIDLLLESGAEAAVVDFKLTSGEPGENHRMQLAGYAMLVETKLGLRVNRLFLYRIPDSRVFLIEMTGERRKAVLDAVAAIRRCREFEILPAPTDVRARCEECEYQNYCADIW